MQTRLQCSSCQNNHVIQPCNNPKALLLFFQFYPLQTLKDLLYIFVPMLVCVHVFSSDPTIILHPPLEPHDQLVLITPQSRDPPPQPPPPNLSRNSDLVPKKQHKEAYTTYSAHSCTVAPRRNVSNILRPRFWEGTGPGKLRPAWWPQFHQRGVMRWKIWKSGSESTWSCAFTGLEKTIQVKCFDC